MRSAASLGNGSVEVKANISIEDNEPLLSIETVNGGSRDTINTETTREYRAILTGDRKTLFRAKLARIGALTGVAEDETFEIVQKNAQDDYDEIEELVFPLEQDEIIFGVRALAYNNLQDELDDNAAPIGVEVSYQAGRAGYARGASETLMRVNLNRLIAPLAWNDGFVATDVALGHEGRDPGPVGPLGTY